MAAAIVAGFSLPVAEKAATYEMAHKLQKTLFCIDGRDNLLRGVSWTFVHP